MYLKICWVFLGCDGGSLSLFGLVDVYSGDKRLLLVTSGHLFSICVVFPLQGDVAACVLLFGFIFLLICDLCGCLFLDEVV